MTDIPDSTSASPAITDETGADAPAAPALRDARGRFVSGAPSPNPSGRPETSKEMVEAARAVSPEALQFLLTTMRNTKAPRRDRIRCAEIIIERAHGKSPQAISLTGAQGESLPPIRFAFTIPPGALGQPSDVEVSDTLGGVTGEARALLASPPDGDVEVTGDCGIEPAEPPVEGARAAIAALTATTAEGTAEIAEPAAADTTQRGRREPIIELRQLGENLWGAPPTPPQRMAGELLPVPAGIVGMSEEELREAQEQIAEEWRK